MCFAIPYDSVMCYIQYCQAYVFKAEMWLHFSWCSFFDFTIHLNSAQLCITHWDKGW